MISIRENVPLAPYTIYKIGGHARFFVEAATADEAEEALMLAKEKNVPFVILGAGSNVLVSDNGFDGLVIRTTGGTISVDGEYLYADAGVMMARAVTESGKQGLTGFEWGIGVPGTIGGSIRGNAGCFEGEMKDVVERVRVLKFSINSKIEELTNKECQFGYRDSIFKTHPEWVILSAILKLRQGDREKVQQEIRRITQERIAKQDIGSKCCGCIFKNVVWPSDPAERHALLMRFPDLAAFANRPTIPSAYLIDHAWLKGMSVGNICISEKHANFFVNNGNGTSTDAMELIAAAKKKVREIYGLELHEEIYLLGF